VHRAEPCHLHVPIVLKSGSLNLLEPYGPVKACNGIALPLDVIQCVQKVLCARRLWYLDLVVSTEVAVEVCCCFTVFSC
jgi:hypothetical protein